MGREDEERPRDERFEPGAVVAGRFRIQHELGSGGMGKVFAAEHLVLRVPVALKVLRPGPARSGQTRQRGRLLREARAASRLDDEHVVRVLDAGELEDGSPFLVMERLRGADVADLLARMGRIPAPDAIALLIQACRAVGAAHAARIVHRDLKPSNLFLCRRPGRPPLLKVLDFGIAKIADDQDVAATTTGATIGSPRYMSPEQILDPRRVDARSDVWSLGITLHELVTGRPPFESRYASALCALITSDEPRLSLHGVAGAPAGLEAIVRRCLEKSPDDRFADAHALAAALEALATSTDIQLELPEEAAPDVATAVAQVAPADEATPSVTLLDTNPAPAPQGVAGPPRHLAPRKLSRVLAVAGAAIVAGGIALRARPGGPSPAPIAPAPTSVPSNAGGVTQTDDAATEAAAATRPSAEASPPRPTMPEPASSATRVTTVPPDHASKTRARPLHPPAPAAAASSAPASSAGPPAAVPSGGEPSERAVLRDRW